MLSVELPKTIEKKLRDVVQKNYQGDIQIAIVAFLKLHEKYGWKEQFLKDVEANSQISNRVGKNGKSPRE